MKNGFRNWSDVRIFLAVMRAGSTLAASRKLGIAQPTVARRIDALEHETGLTLFDRDTRGFRPTGNARELLAAAEAMEAAAQAFEAAAKSLVHARPIRITAFVRNLSPRMTEIISAYQERHPETVFELLPTVKALDLAAGEADIALRVSRTPPDPSLIQRRISKARWALFGSQAYADRHGLPKSADDLDGHRFVTFIRDDIPTVFHHWLTRHVAPDQIAMSFFELDLMHAAIKAGHGLGIMNLKLAESEGGFIQCSDPIPELDADHLMLISPEAHRRPEVRDFTKFFAPRYAAIFK